VGPTTAPGRLQIFDIAGRLKRNLDVPVGVVAVWWDGRDDGLASLPGGVYLARLSSGGSTRLGRVLRLD
jgi:hypothetical protein